MVETETYRIEIVLTVSGQESEVALVSTVLDVAQCQRWRVLSVEVEPAVADPPTPARRRRREHRGRRGGGVSIR
jgi:hypothetical protein